MRKSFIGVLSFWVLAAAVGCSSQAKPIAPALNYERVEQASVEVLVSGRLEGSGWFADGQGHVITAAHIMLNRPDEPLEIVSPTFGRMPAEVVAMDVGHDLALLRVEAEPREYPHLEVAPQSPAIGDDVFVFGTPMFRHGVVLHGRVARSRPAYEWLGTNKEYLRAIYVRGSAPHGSSGGCWVDDRGRVVGNQSGFMSHAKASTGLIFIAPPDAIANLVTTQESVVTPTLNMATEELWEKSTDFIKRFPAGTQGLVPAAIDSDGTAAKANITGEMVITAVDGKRVRYRDEIISLIRASKPGTELTLTVIDADGDAPREINVTVASRE